MLNTVFDVENTVQFLPDGKKDGTPYDERNFLVSVGWKNRKEEGYLCFNHNLEPSTPNGKRVLQDVLDNSAVFIAHNVKHDYSWLLSTGFKLPERTYDTMITEYVLLRGQKRPLTLKGCLKRRGLSEKSDITEEYFAKKIGYEAMPWDIVHEYGLTDVRTTWELYLDQLEELKNV
jgi:DNA polymerase I-like protein with 3'-5' exonuclease and polymerase domains